MVHPINKQSLSSGKTTHNRALSLIFHKMAECYRYMGTEERFRATAYENVSRVLANMKEDISEHAGSVEELDEIGGIGESIAEKIIEYLQTGKIKTFEELKKKLPFDLLELMDISGFGPSTLRTLHEKLGVNNRDDLAKALQENKLGKLKGFGERKLANMKRALKMEKSKNRMLLQFAEEEGTRLLSLIKPINGVEKIALAGSLRRKKETVGDIDMVLVAVPRNRKRIVEEIIRVIQPQKILARGTTKLSMIVGDRETQVDIRLVHDYEFGSAMLYFTGSKEHNIRLRTIAKERGMKINEYGIFDVKTGERLAGETEEEMYELLGLNYVSPEKRIDAESVETKD
jgi:DNA polymerase (family X)